MIKTDKLGFEHTYGKKSYAVGDFDLEALLEGRLDKGIQEGTKYADKQIEDLFGGGSGGNQNNTNRGGGGFDANQKSYEQQLEEYRRKMEMQSGNGDNKMMNTVKNVNPIIAGGLAAGVSKLLGMGWVSSAAIGAGTAGAKHFLIDKK